MSNETVEQIKKRHAQITGWPWYHKQVMPGGDPAHVHHSVCHADTDGISLSGFGEEARNNVEFVAHAPKDMAYLLARVDELEKTLERERRRSKKHT